MKVLIDTHAWLWMLHAPERLSSETRRLVTRRETTIYLSAASSWEIAIKVKLGKLKLPLAPEKYVPSRMAQLGMEPLPVDHVHALKAGGLPPHHRDPFDRMLIAQAQVEGLPLVTADRSFEPYDVKLIWAD